MILPRTTTNPQQTTPDFAQAFGNNWRVPTNIVSWWRAVKRADYDASLLQGAISRHSAVQLKVTKSRKPTPFAISVYASSCDSSSGWTHLHVHVCDNAVGVLFQETIQLKRHSSTSDFPITIRRCPWHREIGSDRAGRFSVRGRAQSIITAAK